MLSQHKRHIFVVLQCLVVLSRLTYRSLQHKTTPPVTVKCGIKHGLQNYISRWKFIFGIIANSLGTVTELFSMLEAL